MSSFDRRLKKMETILNPAGVEFKGRFEIHHLQAWPDCEGVNGMEQCQEHPPSCGVLITLVRSPEHRVIILRDVPWLGLLD